MKISIVLNSDTRNENSNAERMFSGCVNEDFLTDGLFNKIKFFSGFELEVIIVIDEHLSVPEKTLDYIRSLAHVVLIRKHTNEPCFNDWNYIRGLQLATGKIVCHFDQDTAAFANNQESVQELINLLEHYAYVSYPSHWTPNAVHDDSFNYRWVSTRFFMCKRETLNFPEIIKCLTNYEYFCETYKPSRVCPWTEHFLGLIANSSVIYPPIDLSKIAIFSWGSYDKYILQRLNNQSYEDVVNFINSKGGIKYPNDLHI